MSEYRCWLFERVGEEYRGRLIESDELPSAAIFDEETSGSEFFPVVKIYEYSSLVYPKKNYKIKGLISNNWRKMHGLPMTRHVAKRRRRTRSKKKW